MRHSIGLEEYQESLEPVWITERDTVYSSVGVISLMHRASLVPGIDGQDDLGPCVDGPLGEATHASEEIDNHDWLLHHTLSFNRVSPQTGHDQIGLGMTNQ